MIPLEEYAMIGAGVLDESVSTTANLQTMKYDQSIQTPERKQW
jgi:hypothetical protein